MPAFDPDPALRWLFCMTHPDDEISICAWIRRLVLGGSEVWISFTHDTPIRRQEALNAAQRVGISPERAIFHGATDGQVTQAMPDLITNFRAMIAEIKPDRVACGAFEQGHPDHDATNCLVAHTFDGPIFEIPFYYPYTTKLPRVNRFADPPGEEILDLTAAEGDFKMEYAKSFPSQAIYKNMKFAEVYAMLNGDGSLRRTERMRLQGAVDYTRPNHHEHLHDLIIESETWKCWTKAHKKLLESL